MHQSFFFRGKQQVFLFSSGYFFFNGRKRVIKQINTSNKGKIGYHYEVYKKEKKKNEENQEKYVGTAFLFFVLGGG